MLTLPPSVWPYNLVTCALFNTLHAQQYAGVGSHRGFSRGKFFYIAWGAGACCVAAHFLRVFLRTSFLQVFRVSLPEFVFVPPPCFRPPLPFSARFAPLRPALPFTFHSLRSPYPALVCRSRSCHRDPTPSLFRAAARWRSPHSALLQSPLALPAALCALSHPWPMAFLSAPAAFFSALPSLPSFILSPSLPLSCLPPKHLPLHDLLHLLRPSFVSITATIAHTFLFFPKQIWTQSRRAMHEQPDIHARLMAVYWYAIIFVAMFVFGVVSIEVWDTKFPVQYFILALVISFVYVIPIGMIQAITNQQVGLNVITELIIGYALPGRLVAMMCMFKTWGYITMAHAQAVTFTSDFKPGHYMKSAAFLFPVELDVEQRTPTQIPPRVMFTSQVVAGTMQAWIFTNIEDKCDRSQKDGFWCPSTVVFGTASIVWASLGPGANVFSSGEIYYALTFFFLIGFLCPLKFAWLCTLKWPNSWLRYLNFSVIFSGTGLIPPAIDARRPTSTLDVHEVSIYLTTPSQIELALLLSALTFLLHSIHSTPPIPPHESIAMCGAVRRRWTIISLYLPRTESS
ncbi:OPT oligopeptide transporter protein-domain-containing protein [Mycena galericulata]|nr:OPT oligopeptide transporter protein-domain-containing protein [Mycena galericulata]